MALFVFCSFLVIACLTTISFYILQFPSSSSLSEEVPYRIILLIFFPGPYFPHQLPSRWLILFRIASLTTPGSFLALADLTHNTNTRPTPWKFQTDRSAYSDNTLSAVRPTYIQFDWKCAYSGHRYGILTSLGYITPELFRLCLVQFR